MKLTVSCEEANERTHSQYQERVEDCRDTGWGTFLPVKAEQVRHRFLSRLSVTLISKGKALQSTTGSAGRANRWRANPWLAAEGLVNPG